jgi:hypothetical protein
MFQIFRIQQTTGVVVGSWIRTYMRTCTRTCSSTFLGTFLVAGGIAAATAPKAQAAAINFSSPSQDTNNDEWSLGFKFSTNQAIAVHQLGFYDDLQDNLTQSHAVGIFDDGGNLLVSGTVNPGDPLQGWFRYTAIAPTELAGGQTFYIAATTGSERYTSDPIGFTVDPRINYLGGAFQQSKTLVFPGFLYPKQREAFFGPNFQITAVPTPALLPGLLGMGLAAWRRRRIGPNC